MAVAENSHKIKDYTWAMNEVGKDNVSAGLICTQCSTENRMKICVEKIKEEKEGKKAEKLAQKVEEFREVFGEEKEEEER